MPVGKTLYKSLQWKSLQFFTSFLVNIIFARTLRSVVAGEFYSLVYLLSLIISFFTLGLDISLNYYLSRKEMNGATARRIIWAVTSPAVALSLLFLALLNNSHGHYPDLGFSRLLLLSALQITGGLLTSLAGALFTAAGKNHLPARIAFIANTFLAILSLYAASQFRGPRLIDALFGLYFIFSFGQGVLLFFLSGRLPFVTGDTPSPQLRTILRFSFFAFITNFLFFIAARLNVYIAPYWLSPHLQGNYIQAYKLVEYAGLAMSFTYYPFITLVAGEGQEKMRDALLLLVRLSNTVVLLGSILALAAGHWLFQELFGASYERMYSIFTCLVPGLFAVCSSGFFTAWFFGSGHIRYNFISACIQLLTMPVFFILLIGPAGPEGAALAFSLSSLLSLAYDMWIYRKGQPYAVRDILLLRKSDWNTLHRFVRGGRGGRLFQRQ